MSYLPLSSYIIAICGEFLNATGAFVLAWDVLGRERERRVLKAGKDFVNKLHRAGSEIDMDEPELAVVRNAIRLARRGCALIFAGFLFLVAHWGIEIYLNIQEYR